MLTMQGAQANDHCISMKSKIASKNNELPKAKENVYVFLFSFCFLVGLGLYLA
jgi:hypothetical protein